MAKLVFGMNVSLDGYVDHDHAAFTPDPVLFQQWIECVRSASASVNGRAGLMAIGNQVSIR